MTPLEQARAALRKLLSAVNNAEVLGEWSALEINHGMQKKTRALIDADVEFAHQALAALDAAPSVRVPEEWWPIETYKDEWPVCIRAPELVDEFNETGETDACAENGDHWVAAQWCNCQDYFKTIRVTATHWRNKP